MICGFQIREVPVYYNFFTSNNMTNMPSAKKSGLAAPRGCGVSVERDTPRLVPPHSTLKRFSRKLDSGEYAIGIPRGLFAYPRPSGPLSGKRLVSLSFSFSLVDPSSEAPSRRRAHMLLVRPITMTRPLVAPLHPRPVVRRGKYPLVLSP